ncbi:hypothetical protein M9Y10_028807 [Tritrichomonas musculus]|uniref:Uncharacterized protein n=1 Tax=Tritrichomonas musculus TaxID=1915356 RepID=A0ABR2KKB5_9EUKA
MESNPSSPVYVVGEEEEGEGDETYNIFDSSSQNDDLRNDKLQLQFNIDFSQNLFPSFIFEYSKHNIIQFKIPSSILPKSIQHVNDFDKDPTLCDVLIETNLNCKWFFCPAIVSF